MRKFSNCQFSIFNKKNQPEKVFYFVYLFKLI
nr:MAG TPA: hypothetical protein [Caudoviricetes sp.]DAV94298.1 MAG TPA: hypothetical protein [Bacteriophage sp.]